jgi:hypothetical protein
MQTGGAVVGAKRAAQCALDPFRHLGEGHFTIKRSKNGAADKGCAAQSSQDRAAKPLHGDAAAIDHRSLRAIDGKRRLVTKIDDPGIAPVTASPWRPLAQTAVPLISSTFNETWITSKSSALPGSDERAARMFGNQRPGRLAGVMNVNEV